MNANASNGLHNEAVEGNRSSYEDVFTKTTLWIEKSIVVGDVGVQFDPVHAALPWAAFRFLPRVV